MSATQFSASVLILLINNTCFLDSESFSIIKWEHLLVRPEAISAATNICRG